MEATRLAQKFNGFFCFTLVASLLIGFGYVIYPFYLSGDWREPWYFFLLLLMTICVFNPIYLILIAKDVYIDRENLYVFGWWHKAIIPVTDIVRATSCVELYSLCNYTESFKISIVRVKFKRPTPFGRSLRFTRMTVGCSLVTNLINDRGRYDFHDC